MNREDAIVLYRAGEEPTVQVLLDMSATIDRLEKHRSLDKDHPATPSGMKAVYTKPATKTRGRPGRRKGHEGSRRAPPSVVHHTRHHTLTRCPGCRGKLPSPSETRERYTEDLPPVEPEVTRHIIHRYWCSGCRCLVEPPIEDALPGSTLGLKSVIHSAWLHYGLGVTLDNIVQLLNVSAHFRVTASGLFQAWRNLALVLKPAYDQIGLLAKSSAVLHADETGWRVGGRTHWLWCFTNKTLVYFVIDRCRGSPVVKRVLGVLFQGTLITDFFGAYNKLMALNRQVCLAHLFRELVRVDMIHSSPGWRRFRKKLARFLKDAFRLDQREPSLSRKTFDRRQKRLQERLLQIALASYSDKHARRLANRLIRHLDAILTFLDDPEVSPDNNHAERQIRPAVIMRKNSYCNRSERGAEVQAVMMSLFRTLQLRHLNPVESLLSVTQFAIKTGNAPALPPL